MAWRWRLLSLVGLSACGVSAGVAWEREGLAGSGVLLLFAIGAGVALWATVRAEAVEFPEEPDE